MSKQMHHSKEEEKKYEEQAALVYIENIEKIKTTQFGYRLENIANT